MKESKLIKNFYSTDPAHVLERMQHNVNALQQALETPGVELEYYQTYTGADESHWYLLKDLADAYVYRLLRVRPEYRPYEIKDFEVFKEFDKIKDQSNNTVIIKGFTYTKENDALFFELELINSDLTDYHENAKELLNNYTQLDGSPLGVQI